MKGEVAENSFSINEAVKNKALTTSATERTIPKDGRLCV